MAFAIGTWNISMTLKISSSIEKREDVQVEKSNSTTHQDLDNNTSVKEEKLLPK